MDIKNAVHNVVEDLVFTRVDELLDNLAKEHAELCVCQQCRLDTTCYVLNRIPPRYLVSNRGIARIEQASIERQQKEADITALIYEGIRRVNHNLRPNFTHSPGNDAATADLNVPVFNIPTIVGRLFNGNNFSPMSDVVVELRKNGDLVPMKDANWQNPYSLVPNTLGVFTFWPNAVTAESVDRHEVFQYCVEIKAPDFEPLRHIFDIPVISEFRNAGTFSMGRTFKLPDLYMFPLGGEEDELLD